MYRCPHCRHELSRDRSETGTSWRCAVCDGRFATLPFLRKLLRREAVVGIWQAARGPEAQGTSLRCPSCGGAMVRIRVGVPTPGPQLDVCPVCQAVWFDRGELDVLPRPPPPRPAEPALPDKARQRLAMWEAEEIGRRAREEDVGLSGWRALPYLLGLPVRTGGPQGAPLPVATICAAAVTVAASLWGFAHPAAVESFALTPSDLGGARVVTFLTSVFLHANMGHLLGNLYFLLLFGGLAEARLGRRNLIALFLLAGLCGNVLHVLLDPRSTVPCLGASGAVSGVLSFAAFAFPDVKLRMFVRVLPVRLSAATFAMFWFLLQGVMALGQLSGWGDVSALAHLGGALVGLAFLARDGNRSAPYRSGPGCFRNQKDTGRSRPRPSM